MHATHIDADETVRLAKCCAIGGLCLTTEANLGDGIFPARDYLEQRGHIGVGSDSHIGVDWRAELRLLEYGQRLSSRQRNVSASTQSPHVADRLYAASLEGGALATGRAVGALKMGSRADLMVLDANRSNKHPSATCTWAAGK